MNPPRKQPLIIALLVVVVLALGLFMALSGKQNTPKPSTANSTTPTTDVVTLTNRKMLDSYMTSDRIDSVQAYLYKKVTKTNPQAAKIYKGTVRQWSLRIFSQNENTTTAFVVDIPELKQSYGVTVSGDSNSDFNAIYVICPKPNQLIHPAFACEDAEA